ncbi:MULTISPECIES: ferritin-like domain-containing protein [unclassified Nocardia]|uniref:ferritin-like domain-containing protein n=1 Tax=unclassified Nocardia TaxID=2637762 RepID=UPI001CE46904|nr:MULTISPECIES: ferritin-like domain-containing protein [unclassified Nocardia]
MTDAENQALLAALHAEYAAIYAYGVVSAYASRERVRLIAQSAAAHRARRDSTIDGLKAAGVTVPPPDAAYTMPFPVNDPIPAAKLAVAIEQDSAVAWRGVVAAAESEPVRRNGIDALTDCAVRLATWQAILGTNPPTTAFPGKA